MRRLASLAVVATAAFASATASAEWRTISRNEAWTTGAKQGPAVVVASAAAAAAGAVAATGKGLVLPPRLTVAAGPRYGDFGTGLEFSASALFDFPLRGVGSARVATGEALSKAAQADLSRARIDAAWEAAVAWSQALEAKNLIALRIREEKDVEAIVGIATKRWKSGVGLPSDVALARGDLGAAGAATLDAEGNLVDALSNLRFTIGAPIDEVIEPVGDLCVTQDAPVDEKSVYAEAENAPALVLAKAKSASAASDVKLAHATGGPVIGFGASYLHEGTGQQIWTGVVSLPLPITDPARFESARARIAADEAAAEVERVRASVMKAVRLALHDRIHTREVRAKLLKDAIEPLREAVRLARVQFEAGTQELTSVLVTRQRLFAVEEQVLHACGSVHRADLVLARLLGKAPS